MIALALTFIPEIKGILIAGGVMLSAWVLVRYTA